MKQPVALTELLCQLKDKRRKQGRRHSQSDILLTVIIATMSGCRGYRSMEDFCIRYQRQICHALGHPRHGVASYSSIRRVLMEVDFEALSRIFYEWTLSRTIIEKGDWLQMDGKGIKGTVNGYNTKLQNFTSLVSLFMNRTGLVLNVRRMENRQESEIRVVQCLVNELEIKDVTISMDALHCQKKRLLLLCLRVTTTLSR